MSTNTIIGRSVVITLAETDDQGQPIQALVQEIEIDCEGCGRHLVRFAGHHLRAIRNLLLQTIDQFPELCGDEAGLKLKEKLEYTIPAGPKDPSVN